MHPFLAVGSSLYFAACEGDQAAIECLKFILSWLQTRCCGSITKLDPYLGTLWIGSTEVKIARKLEAKGVRVKTQIHRLVDN